MLKFNKKSHFPKTFQDPQSESCSPCLMAPAVSWSEAWSVLVLGARSYVLPNGTSRPQICKVVFNGTTLGFEAFWLWGPRDLLRTKARAKQPGRCRGQPAWEPRLRGWAGGNPRGASVNPGSPVKGSRKQGTPKLGPRALPMLIEPRVEYLKRHSKWSW